MRECMSEQETNRENVQIYEHCIYWSNINQMLDVQHCNNEPTLQFLLMTRGSNFQYYIVYERGDKKLYNELHWTSE
jgi:hypothetical protein